mmetsp:Transcript_43283/g.99182  ORF Transcript_43283/g.99182 Transcript_43283/m.99182 type:complete len:88 (-) Transcript_43283:357-620(-)
MVDVHGGDAGDGGETAAGKGSGSVELEASALCEPWPRGICESGAGAERRLLDREGRDDVLETIRIEEVSEGAAVGMMGRDAIGRGRR